MLAYLATKSQFIRDADHIEDVVQEAVSKKLNLRISSNSSEYRSWQSSLGNAMYHVLKSSEIPSDVGVAIEYRLHGRSSRIDFMLSGFGKDGVRSIVVIELKQWANIQLSLLADHVVTFIGHAERDQLHPSYQVWSYSRVLSDFYEVVTSIPIHIHSCAFVHNCVDDSALRDPSSNGLLKRAPVFIKGEQSGLQKFITTAVHKGDDATGLVELDASPISPSKQLVEALVSMLDGNEEFVLIDEQKTAYEAIMSHVSSIPTGERWVLVVRGGPGTGKSVIAINALVSLLKQGLNVRYVTKNAAPRGVYKAKLQRRSKKADISSLFVSSDAFYNADPDAYDVLLVDEAHRLVRNSGLYGNLGNNQIAEIIRTAQISVFFIDESQKVTWRDIGTVDDISNLASLLEAPVEMHDLAAQFRCSGSDEYLRWVDQLLEIENHDSLDLRGTDYDIRFVDSPSELRDLIFEKNKANNASRLVAGYCWDWVSKKDPALYDIVIPGSDFSMRWNFAKNAPTWIISPNAVNEVGCIHTCQGLEADYMGVIIGPDLMVRDGILVTDPGARARTDYSLRGWKTAMKQDREATLKRADELIRNTYRTLLTRGMSGTYVYCTDSETRMAFQHHLEAARRLG